jgi:hypothetical protein
VAVVVASLVEVAVALVAAVAVAMAVGRVRAVAVGREMAAAVVVELAVAVVVAVVVEVEVAVAGGVPFGPPNEIKIKSTLNNMLVHLIIINLEEPSGYPAQPGLTWRDRRLPNPTRINLEEP